ncbi:unnamed protein product [Gemmata massiliana]|uniref:Uncharacterized protein n=1 Tax=Gemmata massiliana TaxID=1210884 RepID=A0A6P2DG92_9BACT|nr:hypothetical protein [Gemmata massiliana]VTS00737.1 unnamed protein product [Gemmata massiliana]
MDQPAVWIAVGVGLVAVFGVAIYLLRHHARVRGGVKGPFGFAAEVEADNPNPGGSINMKGVTTRRGSVVAATEPGGTIGMENIDASLDVKARTDGGAAKK